MERYHIVFILAPVILFSLLYNIPRYFELTLLYGPYEDEIYVAPSAMRSHPLYVQIYVIWINLVFMGIIPYASLIILNLLILLKVLKMARMLETRENELTRSIFFAKLCLFVVAVFVVSHSIRWIPNIWELYLVSH